MGQRLLEAPRAVERVPAMPMNLEVRFSDGSGVHKSITAKLINTGTGGVGIKADEPLHVHSIVELLGQLNGLLICQQATIRWCRPARSGGYRIGLRLMGKPEVRKFVRT